MRFQVSEMVETQDAELVSRVLETNLRAQWSDVLREGDTIVLHGLGPTHRVNRKDRAIFAVKAVEGGKTAIEIDVTYLASALVGTAAPQNEIVQRKLDGVLELVRMDVDLAQRRKALERDRGLKPKLVINKDESSSVAVAVSDAVEHDATAEVVENKAATQVGETGETVAARKAPVDENISVVEEKAKDTPIPSEDTLKKVLERMTQRERESAIVSESKGDDIGDDIFSPKRADVLARNKAAMQAAQIKKPASSAMNLASPASDMQSTVEQRLVHRGDVDIVEEGGKPERMKERSAGLIFATLLVTFFLAFLAQIGWQYRAQVSQQLTSWRAIWSAERVDQSQPGLPKLTPDQQAAQQRSERLAAAADAEKAAEAARLAEPDPKQWLENWVDTMKGTDAGAQAAYYANPVDKYFLRYSVSRADVMAARQDAIAKRKGTWTMRLDDVVVAQQTDTTARILFIKYIATDEGSGVVEQRLPTQIKLKRIDGQWRIVSEQTLG
ncbi:hypothetical protein GCM10011507_26710 [Edaphobacter acidisoli]|uniref:Uncharacterized protein n=1 Tax=Edaphobacter acidisoli TaxID=2040573 RepID=A0A916RWA4_9BACT|nr:hypothetical protein [Edaphobacter acidisoli]GGA74005.1 hypothetical protein GCM10011507_26710 [Edaphobacter acidisoli]